MSLMNSPIKKNNGEDEGLNLPKALKFAANNAFGTEQAKPVNSAETATLSPQKRAETAATPNVAKICSKTILLIFFSKVASTNPSLRRIIRYVTYINKGLH